ncbi:MAG: penicillin acylase family protein, partial [Salinibacter sp.]
RRVDPAEVPDYMAPRVPQPSVRMFRPQRSIEMVARDSSITFAELQAYKNDTRMLAADRLLDDLLPAVQEHGGAQAQRAAEVLSRWDRTANAESQGSVLFAAWLRAMVENGAPFATPYRPEAPRSTPDGLADPEAAVETLRRAARRVKQQYDSLTVAWGDVHRLVGPNGTSYPASGGTGIFGLFRVLWFGERKEGRRRATGGDSYIALIEFADDGPRAKAVLPYGNASQPGSPHRGDQLKLYAEKEMRRVWLSRDSVRAHLEARTSF